MTLSYWTSTVNVTSDSLWRTEMTAIHDSIVAVGLVQTSDTGQLDISAATRPSTSTAAGYRVYRFDDALQATYPCYIKVEFGTGGVTSSCAVWITIGTSTDGAGNLGTIKSQQIQLLNSGATSGTYTSGVSGSTSRMTFVWCLAGGNTISHWCSIERIQNTSGADTSTGLVIVAASRTLGSSGNWNQVLYYSGNQPGYSNVIGTVMMGQPTATTWAVGADTGTGPICPLGWGIHPCIQGGLSYFNGDVTASSQPTVSHYGTNRTFIALGSANVGSMYNLASAASILSRWD